MAVWAIIGTRETTEKQFEKLCNISKFLVRRGHHIRTGGAVGADEAAMVGAASVDVSKLHVFLPWENYNQRPEDIRKHGGVIIPDGANTYLYNESTCPNWAASVDKYHPEPDRLSRGPRALHARNFGIVMFPEPVVGVIAMPGSNDPEKWGGTGQGMRIALGEGVPLYNIRIKDEWERLKKILDAMKE